MKHVLLALVRLQRCDLSLPATLLPLHAHLFSIRAGGH